MRATFSFRSRRISVIGAVSLVPAVSLIGVGALAPIAAAAPDRPTETASCQGDELADCFRTDQMRELAETGERMVTEYLAHTGITRTGINDDSVPTLTYIPAGSLAISQCVDVNGRATQDDQSFNYCRADNTVYVGQNNLWESYQQYGALGPVSGLAHEYGHFIQSVMQVPLPSSPADNIRSENQADCLSGTFISYLNTRGHIEDPRDVDRVEQYLTATASVDAPGRDHGTAEERVDSFELGYRSGLPACSQFTPATPLTR